jgi:hypothetical protein
MTILRRRRLWRSAISRLRWGEIGSGRQCPRSLILRLIFEPIPPATQEMRVTAEQPAPQPKHGSWLDSEAELSPVPRSTHPRQAGRDRGSRRLAARSQQEQHQGRLAVHHC